MHSKVFQTPISFFVSFSLSFPFLFHVFVLLRNDPSADKREMTEAAVAIPAVEQPPTDAGGAAVASVPPPADTQPPAETVTVPVSGTRKEEHEGARGSGSGGSGVVGGGGGDPALQPSGAKVKPLNCVDRGARR